MNAMEEIERRAWSSCKLNSRYHAAISQSILEKLNQSSCTISQMQVPLDMVNAT